MEETQDLEIFTRQPSKHELSPNGNLLQKLKSNIERALKREPKGPKISVNFFFSPHRTEKDIEKLRPLLKETDIYFIEGAGWESWAIDYYQKLSRGEITAEELLRETGWKPGHLFYSMRLAELSILYGSNKVIGVVDVPASHSSVKRHEEIPQIEIKEIFDKTLETVKDFIQVLAHVERMREEYMILHIRPKIKEIIDNSPILKKKRKVEVLLHLGAAHTIIHHEVKKQGFEIQREFASRPYIFSYRDEALRKYFFGKEISQDLLAHILLEQQLHISEIGASLEEISPNTDQYFLALRRIVSKFKTEEIEKIFTKVAREQSFPDGFQEEFTQKGLKLPGTEEELRRFLSR